MERLAARRHQQLERPGGDHPQRSSIFGLMCHASHASYFDIAAAGSVISAIDPQIGRIKDISSAAAGLVLIIAGITWLLALAECLGLF